MDSMKACEVDESAKRRRSRSNRSRSLRPRLRGTAMAVLLLMTTGHLRADFVPWDDLVDDSWIAHRPEDEKLVIHTVNAGDYDVGFDQARSSNGARGMNSVKLSHGGTNIGHMVSYEPVGSFEIQNTGDHVFSDLLILVAVAADSLPANFAFSLAGRTFDRESDFGFYDAAGFDAGRPSGYYSVTNPPAERLGYDLDSGMVTIMGLTGLSLGGATPAITVDYAFENLPSRAVFSAYGVREGIDWIFHTNRGLTDANDPGRPVSTFEVIVPEPVTGALLAAGVVAAAGLRRGER